MKLTIDPWFISLSHGKWTLSWCRNEKLFKFRKILFRHFTFYIFWRIWLGKPKHEETHGPV